MNKKRPSFDFVFGGFKQKNFDEDKKPIILPHTKRQNSSTPSYGFLSYYRKKHPLKPGKLCKKVFPEDYEQESQNQDCGIELDK